MQIDLTKAKILEVAQTNIPDCFVLKNKIGTAHGEAKLYVGGTASKEWGLFFNNFNIKGLFLKADILTYLDLAKSEYENQTQLYRKNIANDWNDYFLEASKLDDIILFDIQHKEYKNKSRYYVNSDSPIYEFFRKIALPIMTSLIIETISIDNNIYAWFRPYINEIGNIYESEIALRQEDSIRKDSNLDSTVKEQIIKARKGQGKFREQILEKYNNCCAITGVNDNRVLVASHIKPWTVATNSERLSKENGLLLIPTFDKLFDKGFISFDNKGKILLSDFFSEQNFKRLDIDSSIKCRLLLSSDMKSFLDYHRDQVFKH